MQTPHQLLLKFHDRLQSGSPTFIQFPPFVIVSAQACTFWGKSHLLFGEKRYLQNLILHFQFLIILFLAWNFESYSCFQLLLLNLMPFFHFFLLLDFSWSTRLGIVCTNSRTRMGLILSLANFMSGNEIAAKHLNIEIASIATWYDIAKVTFLLKFPVQLAFTCVLQEACKWGSSLFIHHLILLS